MRTKKLLFILLLLAFILLTSGCLESLFNQSPIIGSIPGTTAKVGMVYTYAIIATDPDEDTLTYTLSVKPDGMTINESTGVVSWTPTEAQVGEHQVIIEVSDGKVSVSQNFTITVAEALIDSIVVVPSEMTIYIGDSEDITSIIAHYDNETTADIELDSDDVSYSSDDTDVATVGVNTGVVTGVSEGRATITVSYTEGGITETDTISVTVQEPPILTSISVQPPLMIIYVGYSESTTSITASYDDGPNALIELSDSDVFYFSDNINIATVNTLGVVTGVSAGIATITVVYTEGGITMTDTVDVTIVGLPE